MSCKCKICGVNDVDFQGGVCELCAIGQDPYAQSSSPYTGNQSAPNNQSYGGSSKSNKPRIGHHNTPPAPKASSGTGRKMLLNGGASTANTDPYGNDMTPSTPPPVQVYSAGQVPQAAQQNLPPVSASAPTTTRPSGNIPLTTGITKNISTDNHKRSIIVKWVRALFMGIPFTLDDDITMFQVYPDFSGSALNSLGNACDQVIVYGRLNKGTISENNDVEVYGRRDSSGNIIARTIKNKASGTTITAQRALGPGGVWTITLLALALVAAVVCAIGIEGIIWAIVIVICLTNLPTVFKILSVILGGMFSVIKRFFR